MHEDEIFAELQPERLGRSLFGCDGGNVGADLWVCGVEFGGDHEELTDPEWSLQHYPATHGGAEGEPLLIPWRADGDYLPPAWLASDYDKRLARFCLRFLGWQIVAGRWPPTREEVSAFLIEHLYDQRSPIFKLNLFAYARRNEGVEWDGAAKRLT